MAQSTAPFANRKMLEHAKEILEHPRHGHLTPLEDQQYRFFTTMNLVLRALVISAISELPKEGV